MGVTLRLSEFHLVHTLASVPVHVRATLVHSRELKPTRVR